MTARGKQQLARTLAGLEDAIRTHEEQLAARCDRLRETADQLRAGEIHPAHAANRVRKIAEEISSSRDSGSSKRDRSGR